MTADYGYDGDGVRTSKVVNGVTAPQVWDRAADEPLLAADGTDDYLSDTGGSMLGQLDGSSNPSYYLGDGLGSLRGTSDMTGTLTGSVDYDVFGLSRSSGGTATAFRFTGEQTDPETGSVFLRSRYYGPGAGRFMSPDSMMPNAAGTQGYNLYTYVGNNPMLFVDPTGYDGTETSAPFLSGYSIQEACLLTPSCGPGLRFFLGLAKGGAQALQYQGTIVGDVGVWLTLFGTVGVIFENLDCALDFNVAITGATVTYSGCGGLAHQFQLLLNTLGSPGPLLEDWTKQALDLADKDLPKIPEILGCSCSVDTLVATDAGERAIGTLHVGDRVLAWNQAAASIGYYGITAVLSHVDAVIESLNIDGESIETTPEHPFYTAEKGWVPAGSLWPGAHVSRAEGDGGTVLVKSNSPDRR